MVEGCRPFMVRLSLVIEQRITPVEPWISKYCSPVATAEMVMFICAPQAILAKMSRWSGIEVASISPVDPCEGAP